MTKFLYAYLRDLLSLDRINEAKLVCKNRNWDEKKEEKEEEELAKKKVANYKSIRTKYSNLFFSHCICFILSK